MFGFVLALVLLGLLGIVVWVLRLWERRIRRDTEDGLIARAAQSRKAEE